MSRPALPGYTSSENTAFHPVFRQAAEEALKQKSLSTRLEVVPQYPTPSGPADFVFRYRDTGKILLPAEIKRTKSSVRGPGRRQARDYRNNLGDQCGPFYCASNLELTEFFRDDARRPQTSAQKIKLRNDYAGELPTTGIALFYTDLIAAISEMIDIAMGRVAYEYVTGLSTFQGHIAGSLGTPQSWHKLFMPVCYEYIRGTGSKGNAFKDKTANWRSASLYKETPARLIELGRAIDFESAFQAPAPDRGDPVAFRNAILEEAYDSGQKLGRGDDIGALVNELLIESDPSLTPTDIDLAQLMASLGKVTLGRDLKESEQILDPGAGTGNLLTVLPQSGFPSLNPKQVWAVEKIPQFSETLSLRLGLAFAPNLSPENAPRVDVVPIESINKAQMDNVKLVLMNPPFIAGTRSVGMKNVFSRRIHELTNAPPTLDNGQIAFEALFLELVWALVSEGTIIVSVFPVQHLTRLSKEVAALRSFLAGDFGLKYIVTHPREGLFKSVTKETVLIIGQKGAIDEEVGILQIEKPVADVDFAELIRAFDQQSGSMGHGISLERVARSKLAAMATSGWNGLWGAREDARFFVDTYLSGYALLENNGGENLKRGTLANSGNKKLTVFDKNHPEFPSVVGEIPASWLRPALNNTDALPRELSASTAPDTSFVPPSTAYEPGTNENKKLRKIIDSYLETNESKPGKQARAKKKPADIISDLKSDQKELNGHWVLIPRASRSKGQISLLKGNGIVVSTNVMAARFDDKDAQGLIASWLLSIFGQLQMELFGTPHEGARKLEAGSIKKIRIPPLSSIPKQIAKEMLRHVPSEPAINFENIVVRPTDTLWAEVIAPANPKKCLEEALACFKAMVDERRGLGAR